MPTCAKYVEQDIFKEKLTKVPVKNNSIIFVFMCTYFMSESIYYKRINLIRNRKD